MVATASIAGDVDASLSHGLVSLSSHVSHNSVESGSLDPGSWHSRLIVAEVR